MKSSLVLSLIFIAISISGCSEYWWTRGQPPSVSTMISRSQTKLAEARTIRQAEPQSERSAVVEISRRVEESLLQVVASIQNGQLQSTVAADLMKTQEAFVGLEGKVSVGSRAPYGELSGQLRALAGAAGRGEKLEYPAVGLFAARTFSFLADELALPSNS